MEIITNDTLKNIATRYSCRAFDGKCPSDEELRAIAQAAIAAPSGMNRQHWQVIMVKNKSLIDEMDTEGMRIMSIMPDQSMYNRICQRGGKLFYNAPTMAVVAIKEALPKGAELIDCGILVQNISLAATSLGIDNLHCGLIGFAFAGERADEFKSRLRFADGYECGMAVLLGYASDGAVATPHAPDPSKIIFIE